MQTVETRDTSYRDFKIPYDSLNEAQDLHLTETYGMCVSELTLQQSKRDQIIAFYLTIISFAIPAILGININFLYKGIGILCLAIIGACLLFVIIRHRVYKEVYWVTSRVISQLYRFDNYKIDKALTQGLFMKALRKNRSSVVVLNKSETKVLKLKTLKKQLNSAETTLFEVLVIIVSAVLFISVSLIIYNISPKMGMATSVIGGLLAALINLAYWNVEYCKKLTEVYKTVWEQDKVKADDYFNTAYKKAWFLHFNIE